MRPVFDIGPLRVALAVVFGGAALAPAAGALAVTLDDDTLSATGIAYSTGALAVTLDADTLSATGVAPAAGALAVTLDDDTLSATGVAPAAGALAITLADDTLSGAGTAPVAGALAVTLDNDTLSSAGVVGYDVAAGILGSLLFADYWAADRDNPAAVNPRITIVTGASNWPEEAARNAAAVQGTGSAQPALSATSFGGKPGVSFDGSSDAMLITLSPGIADTGRVYVWLLAKWTGAPAGNYRRGYEFADAGNSNILTLSFTDTVTAQHGWVSTLDGTDDVVQPYANDTAVHLFEAGTLSTTVGKYLRDGSASNGSGTGGVDAAVTKLVLGDSAVGTAKGPICIHRMIIAHNPSSIGDLPSAAQLAAMRAYLSNFL